MHIISLHFYVTLWFKFNFTLHTSIMNTCLVQFTSFHFSQSVLSNSLWPHELQHARPPCATPTSRAYPNSCPLSGWCHPTISSSVVPFSSCAQSFPASGSFQMSQLFASGGQSIRGLPSPWDSPGKNTGMGCHFLLQWVKVKSESEVAQSCPTLATPWTAAYQAPPSMGFSRQEYWSGVPLPSMS